MVYWYFFQWQEVSALPNHLFIAKRAHILPHALYIQNQVCRESIAAYLWVWPTVYASDSIVRGIRFLFLDPFLKRMHLNTSVWIRHQNTQMAKLALCHLNLKRESVFFNHADL